MKQLYFVKNMLGSYHHFKRRYCATVPVKWNDGWIEFGAHARKPNLIPRIYSKFPNSELGNLLSII
jgi:hypothetical protein